MRAINLVPADSRPGRVTAGKSGGAAYGVVGLLAVLLLGMIVLSLSKRDESRANEDLATVEQSTQAYTQVASQFESFEAASKAATDRIATVRSLADARFDWAGSMRDLARVVPKDARISSLAASISSDSGGSGTGSQYRSALPAPAIIIAGCSASQYSVARLVSNLQSMRRVTNVTLESSELASETLTGAGDPLDESGPCLQYTFAIDIFFAPGSAQSSKTAVPSATAASSIATESVNGGAVASTTPASSTTTTATTPAATTPTTSSTAATTPAATTPGK
jgi:Tfp pilus assembly protein PilN